MASSPSFSTVWLGIVPSAASAVVSAFGTPILGGSLGR